MAAASRESFSCLVKLLPSAYSAPDSLRSAGPRPALMVWFWTGPLCWLAYFHPVYRQQSPPPNMFDSSAVTKSFTLYPCVLVRWGALRLRESFLLFVSGVPPGDALGMTFVESLTPPHTHIHMRTSTHTFHVCLFFFFYFQAAHWLGAVCCVTPTTRAWTHTNTHITQRPPSVFTVGERCRGSPIHFSTLN